MSQSPLLERQTDSAVKTRRYQTIIFNNDYTPIDVVVMILMRATGCNTEEASIETWEAHTYGKASVHFSSQEECEVAANLISSVGIKTEVKPEWED